MKRKYTLISMLVAVGMFSICGNIEVSGEAVENVSESTSENMR